jgi:hypothetical protein
VRGRAVDAHGQLVWRYDPPSVRRHGTTAFYCVVQDDHCWGVQPAKMAAFTGKYAAATRVVDSKTKVAPLRESELMRLSTTWHRPKIAQCADPPIVLASAQCTVAGIDAAIDAARAGREPPEGGWPTAVVRTAEPEKLAAACWEAGNSMPGSLVLKRHVIEGFSVRCNAGLVRVRRVIPVTCEQPAIECALTARAVVLTEEHLTRMRASFQPAAGLSHYSKSISTARRLYGRSAMCGLLPRLTPPPHIDWWIAKPWQLYNLPDPDAEYCCFDYARAYTGHLAAIDVCPVETAFDELFACTDDVAIVEHASYLVRYTDVNGRR